MQPTPLCALLGVKYPIIQGGMMFIATAELAAAVSEAGGLGVVSSYVGDGSPEAFRSEIQRAKALTRQPLAVNFSVGGGRVLPYINVAMDEGVMLAITAAGSPATYTRFLKDAGMKVLHVVASVRQAQRAEQEGVDAVIAEGYEAGGENGFDETTTMALVPQIVDAVRVPVVAAGGIADGRGLVAALALGAQGVQMGTRFIATTECVAHPAFKKAIMEAGDVATTIAMRKISVLRVLRNEATTHLREMDYRGASQRDILAYLGGGRVAKALLDGDMKEGLALCGQIAGLVKTVKSVREVVEDIVQEADAILDRLGSLQG